MSRTGVYREGDELMNNQRVLVITNMYPTSEHKSFGIFVKNQVDALKKRQVHVDVIAVTNPKSGKVNVIKKYSAWFIKTILNLVTKGKTYDVIHAHYVFPSGFLGLLFKKLFGIRLVVTAHGGDIDKMAKKSRRLFKLTEFILHEADHVIAVGEELHEQIITTFSVDQRKVSIINMGVNREVFKPHDQGKARMLCGIAEHEKVILFVGNILQQKGISELIDAIDLIHQSEPSVRLYLIGAEKSPSFKHQLERVIKDNQLENIVQFLGTKEQPVIAKWMSAADCVVLPSYMEGFGLVALEAMACETPVVGTNVGGLKYLLADGAGVISPVKNSVELANSILYILSSEKERNKIIRNGIIKAEENDQERMLNRVMDVYFPTGG